MITPHLAGTCLFIRHPLLDFSLFVITSFLIATDCVTAWRGQPFALVWEVFNRTVTTQPNMNNSSYSQEILSQFFLLSSVYLSTCQVKESNSLYELLTDMPIGHSNKFPAATDLCGNFIYNYIKNLNYLCFCFLADTLSCVLNQHQGVNIIYSLQIGKWILW